MAMYRLKYLCTEKGIKGDKMKCMWLFLWRFKVKKHLYILLYVQKIIGILLV